jgi:hypothetical protein
LDRDLTQNPAKSLHFPTAFQVDDEHSIVIGNRRPQAEMAGNETVLNERKWRICSENAGCSENTITAERAS